MSENAPTKKSSGEKAYDRVMAAQTKKARKKKPPTPALVPATPDGSSQGGSTKKASTNIVPPKKKKKAVATPVDHDKAPDVEKKAKSGPRPGSAVKKVGASATTPDATTASETASTKSTKTALAEADAEELEESPGPVSRVGAGIAAFTSVARRGMLATGTGILDRVRTRSIGTQLSEPGGAPAGGVQDRNTTEEFLALTTLPPVATLPPAPLAELDAKEISAWFGDHQVLDRVSLTMPAGVITSLIGPSGCGKSTFLRILNRMHELIPAASLAGEVLLDGVDIYDADRRLVDARKSIGMVFQKPNPFPAMSIYDNVIAGLKLTGIAADRDRKDFLVERSLTKAGLWKEVRDRLRAPGGGLSGGQQQRLCIARSLAVAPRVLLMDEPCSALDPTSTRVIEETMLELANEVTIVIVTHNMQQAQRVSTQCAFFLASQGKPGGIVEHGSTEAMFSDPIDSRTHDYVNGVFG